MPALYDAAKLNDTRQHLPQPGNDTLHKLYDCKDNLPEQKIPIACDGDREKEMILT